MAFGGFCGNTDETATLVCLRIFLLLYQIDLFPFFKGRSTFEKFRKHLGTDQEKAGGVQAFEVSYALAWKTMKRILEKKGIDVRSPRDCFREAALNGMISNPKIWFGFIEKRNLTVHTYDEIVMESVIGIFEDFSKALTELVDYIACEQKKSFISGA